jgi:hypothetical protein
MGITTILWWFISPRLHEISTLLATGLLYALRIFYIFVIFGIAMLYMVFYSKYMINILHVVIRFTIVFLFPFNVLLGKCIGINKDRIRESFVQVNNSFLKIGKKQYLAKEILILLPHCIQNFDCGFRITNNIDNCSECGKCQIMKLKQIARKYELNIAIATGGTLARKIIVQTKPKCIIAVACQRDLVDGLIDVFPIPVYGVLNDRPEGPCINTTVDIMKIEDFLKHFCFIEANKI